MACNISSISSLFVSLLLPLVHDSFIDPIKHDLHNSDTVYCNDVVQVNCCPARMIRGVEKSEALPGLCFGSTMVGEAEMARW